MEEKIAELLRTMVQHATIFLADAKEFWPFGGVFNQQGDIVPLAAYPGGEYPESADAIALLEKAIADKFRKQEVIAAAIVVDTNFRETLDSKRGKAIKVRLMVTPAVPEDHYYLYRIEDDIVNLYEYIIYREKTLNDCQ
ncbi:hypothetical protein GCM10028824_34320 [Hymenobacter segetis]|uniref:Nuclear transport factor 2 family protein n=1 Tax=Hymenobacter segetis TaxID=2025509 RepID=A0ABU9LUZ8_9BACT